MHTNSWLSPPFAVIFSDTADYLFLTNSDNIFCSRLVFFWFSYFSRLYLNNRHKKDDVIFCPWSHSVAPNSSEIIFVSHNRFILANLWPTIMVLQKKMLRYSYGQNRAWSCSYEEHFLQTKRSIMTWIPLTIKRKWSKVTRDFKSEFGKVSKCCFTVVKGL